MNRISPFLKKFVHPNIILAVVFVIVIGVEAYLLYFKVYAYLSTKVENVQAEDIVRLDLNNYNKTLELLDSLNTFAPENPSVNNPFK